MNRETTIWLIVFVIGAALLAVRGVVNGGLFGTAYVEAVPKTFVQVAPDGGDEKWIGMDSEESLDHDLTQFGPDRRMGWVEYDNATPRQYAEAVQADPAQTRFAYSRSRTIGVWLSAFFTLAIFSFLYRDNPFYKVAESVVVGVSAAYWMVVGFWSVLIPNLAGRLAPLWVKSWAMPGLDSERQWQYLVPLLLGILLLWRLAPRGAWISRWPLAFIIGTTAGIRLMGFIHADFLSQIRSSIVPLYARVAQMGSDGLPLMDASGAPITGFSLWDSLQNLVLVVGVLACLIYFFFSFEHKGFVGKSARLGIWFLMVTFGAAFGFTVMGRIALLAIRLEFLFDDWLWLIDPTGKRLAELAGILMPSVSMLT